MPNPRTSGVALTTATAPSRSNSPRIRGIVATACIFGLAASVFPPTTVFAKKPARHAKSAGASKKAKKKTVAVRAGFVRVETAKLRKSPNSDGRTVGLLDAGRTARVVGRKEGWLRIKLATGTEGWVRADLLKVSRRPKYVPVAAAAPVKKAKPVKAAKAAKPAKMAAAQRHAAAVAAKVKRQQQVAAKAKAVAQKHKLAAAAKAKRIALAARLKASKKIVVAKKTNPAAPRKNVARVAHVTPRFFVRGGVSLPHPSAPRVALAPARSSALPVAEATAAALATRVNYGPADPNATLPAAAGADALESSPDAVLVEPSQDETVVLADEPTNESAVVAAVRAAVAAPRLPSRNERIVRTALTYRGTPYRFGARGRGAFDCSGFTSYLFNNAGAGIPRTAAQQFKKGRVVPKSQLAPGDLVFFRNTYKRGVSHVGIYIGNGQFVHAAGTRRGVRVDHLSGRFYQNHWAGARRPM